ncbi:hypothetical protein niasHT_001189 [Heterodera trifolii]|uniref:Uncharacterized protein n=1 Tax=Heterodera trifolii TaxID=157864 RepID=A0ABD2MDG9_9BILA
MGLNPPAFQSLGLNPPAFHIPITGTKFSCIPITGTKPTSISINGTQPTSIPITGTQSTSISITGTQFSGIPITGTKFSCIPITGTKPTSISINGTQPTSIPITGTQPSSIPVTGTQFTGIPITGTKFSCIPITGTKFSCIPITGTKPTSITINGTQPTSIPITGTQSTSISITGTQFSCIPITGTKSHAFQSLGLNLMHSNHWDSTHQHFNKWDSILRHTNDIPITGTQPSSIPVTGTQFTGIPITGTKFSCIPITGTKFSCIPITGTKPTSITINGTQPTSIPITGTQSTSISITGTQFSCIPITGTKSHAFQSLGLNLMHSNHWDSTHQHFNKWDSILRHTNDIPITGTQPTSIPQKMGEKAITDHIRTTKHKKNLAEFNRNVPLTDFVNKNRSAQPTFLNNLLDEIKETGRFSIGIDSTSMDNIRYYAIVIRYWHGETKTGILEVCSETNEKAVDMETFLTSLLERCGLPLAHFVSLCADNTTANFGEKTNIVGIGCSSHICNNAIGYAVEKCDYDVRNFSRTIADHFSNHPGRWELFQEMAAEENVIVHIFPAYTAIRRMSLGRTFKRIREMWTVLEKYFRSLRDRDCPKFLRQIFDDELTPRSEEWKVIECFMCFAFDQFNQLNLISQQFYEDAYEYLGNWSRQFSETDEVIGDWVIFESEPSSEKVRIGIFVGRQLMKWMLCLGKSLS